MSTTTNSSVYIGNLDERVSERVLYDILIQAGRVIDLHIPKDKETEKPKGFAFAEYESAEIANYAVRLFSGLVVLYNRTLKFAISGQDKLSHNKPSSSASAKPRSHPGPTNGSSLPPRPTGLGSHSGEHRSRHDGKNFEYGRRAFGSALNDIDRSRSRRFESSDPVQYPSY